MDHPLTKLAKGVKKLRGFSFRTQNKNNALGVQSPEHTVPIHRVQWAANKMLDFSPKNVGI